MAGDTRRGTGVRISVHGPERDNGRRAFIAERVLWTENQARSWADTVYPDAEEIIVSDNTTGRVLSRRTAGSWTPLVIG